MRQKLTDLTVRQLPHPESGDVKYWDMTVRGFGVRVTSQTKSFFVVRGKKRQLTTIGRYPEISLLDARKEARRLLVQEPGKNPSMRLVDAVEAYLEDCQSRLRPKSVLAYRHALYPVPDVSLSDMTRKHIENPTAHQLKAYKALFNWCQREDLVTRNPFAYSSVSFNQRSRVLTDEEIRVVWQYEFPPYSDILKLCLLTGQRLGEVTRFNEAWIKEDTITIPAGVAKNGRENTVPFNLLTAHYLTRYMGQSFNGFSKAKERFDRLHPLPHWTTHDLRRTYATIHARIGTPVHVVERMLNHSSGTISGVAAIYIRHNYLKEMRHATLAYETHIANIVGARA